MSEIREPQLAAPGAGLPKVELLVARMIFGRVRRKRRSELNRLFNAERRKIQSLVESCDQARAGKRVLIDRIRGLEDSSRYWSVFMVLDHLRIVNQELAGVIQLLQRGKTPDHPASTAAVKPDSAVDASVVSEFEEACDVFVGATNGESSLKTMTRFAHPWFGPLNASDWHAMGAMHMGIHRKQVEAILRKQ